VRLVDEADEVVWVVVDQAVRPLARRPPVEDARVVLDAVAEAHLAQHLHVVLRALTEAMRFEQLALGLELGTARVQLAADLLDRRLDRALAHVVVRGRPDGHVLEVVLDELAGERIEVLEALDLVAEQCGAVGGLGVGGEDLERFAAHAEGAAPQRLVVARVLDRDELAQQLVAIDIIALAQDLQVVVVGLRRAEAEDRRHAGHDDHVAAREQRRGGGMAQPIDLLVDRRVLLDVEVLRWDVGLGLVVVVVRDEVLDRVVGEERPELVAQLRGQRLVVREHERRLLRALDDAGHRHRLAGAGGAEQGDEALAGAHALGDAVDRLRLVGGGGEDRIEAKLGH
jgi:hypothetical protein